MSNTYKIWMSLIFFCSILMGQEVNLNIINKSGDLHSVPIADILKVTFTKSETGALVVETADSSPQHSVLTDIDKITFAVPSHVNTFLAEEKVVPTFLLLQNYPNPFNPATTIEFEIYDSQWTTASILNIQGQVVRHLSSEFRSSGMHRLVWDGTNDAGQSVSSGVYFYRIAVGQTVQMKKCVFVD